MVLTLFYIKSSRLDPAYYPYVPFFLASPVLNSLQNPSLLGNLIPLISSRPRLFH